MIKKTKSYDMFKFREDNRAAVNLGHVEKLKQSISSKNLLNLRPIVVNEDMEIIDGQHRLLAAKSLDVEIFYEIRKELQNTDIVLLNISKSWSGVDFLNYYAKNGYKEYQALDTFIKSKGITLSLAFCLLAMKSGDEKSDFKHGKFVFKKEIDDYFDMCWRTIDIIKGYIGTSSAQTYFTKTSRFWKALIILFQNENFEEETWVNNLKKSIDMVGPRISVKGYLRLFCKIYNHRTIKKIIIEDEGAEE